MKWVTREHPKIDRIACPWLISRFIDPKPEFLFVPARDVLATGPATDFEGDARPGGTAFDIGADEIP